MNGNAKATVAVLKTDIRYMKQNSEELKKRVEKNHNEVMHEVKSVKDILTNGSNKIAKLREGQKNLWWVLGALLTIFLGTLGIAGFT